MINSQLLIIGKNPEGLIMKTKILGVLVLAICFIFVAATSYAEDAVVKLKEMSGMVMVKVQPATEWTQATAGQILKKNDSIKTEADGKAVLEFPNNNSVSLKPKTEISIEELVWDAAAKKVGINMTSGELKTVLNKVDTPSDFKIKTPTAICGARGTIFYVVVFADGTGVYVEQGLVEFLNTISGQSYTVYEGNRSDSNSDGSITEPQTLSKDEVDAIIADYDMKPVAEPYTEPGGDNGPDLKPLEVQTENPASES